MTVNLFIEQAFADVIHQLGRLGYRNELIVESYAFPDWFEEKEERVVPVATFGQTPISYETACLGVVCANGTSRQTLIDEFRSLGAPTILEVDKNEIREWAVSREEGRHKLVESISHDQIEQLFVDRATYWKPEEFLRAKNIGSFSWTQQTNLFAGLVPELEERIQESLEPLIHEALSKTKSAYHERTGRVANPTQLFKLIFWILAAKVFYDREINGFASLTQEPAKILEAISKQYQEPIPRLLNQHAREIAVTSIWNELDFRHLSVDVLAQMWSSMLIDKETKKRLGIQRTSRTIVRYIIDKLKPFHQSGDDQRVIFEPCSGSAGFLIGAMNALRPNLFGMSAADRHDYFVKHLIGIEADPFGVEISKLALTLADFPNLGGWQIHQGDVFRENALKDHLQRAGAVLCNPPFRAFDQDERRKYQIKSPLKPVDLLNRILDDLHPSGVLGIVLPRSIVDGRGYKDIRSRLARRFASIDLTILPDRAFEADVEVGLLVANEPIPHNKSKIAFSHVSDSAPAWHEFEVNRSLSSHYKTERDVDELAISFGIPPLQNVWESLKPLRVLGEIATFHRGLEWNVPLTKDGKETGNRDFLVRNEPLEGYLLGVAPQTKFNVFEVPRLHYLNAEKEYQRRSAYLYDWDRPKVILGKAPTSRGPWRLTAFPDNRGIACYTTFMGVWSESPLYDEYLLTAILNSPVANAFVATREGKLTTKITTLKQIPIPEFSERQSKRLRDLIKRYQASIKPTIIRESNDDSEYLLKQIDALVLDGYKMSPRIENQILKYFQGHSNARRTSHFFGDYLQKDYESFFSLSTHLSPKFQKASVGALLTQLEVS